VQTREPIFNVPGVVVVVAIVLAGVHLVTELFLEQPETTWLVYAFGFVPARYWSEGPQFPGWPWATVLSPVTHMLLHGNWIHVGVNLAWLLAVGTPLAWRMGNVRFLLFGIFCGVAGAALFFIINPLLDVPVIGASGGISGLMGGMFRLMFSVESRAGAQVLRYRPDIAWKQPLSRFVANRRALAACAAFIALNLLLGLGVPGLDPASGGGIAWEAHVGGFLAGIVALDWFDPARPAAAHNEPWQDHLN
jgi:membrane associated rhomboid family serine protease